MNRTPVLLTGLLAAVISCAQPEPDPPLDRDRVLRLVTDTIYVLGGSTTEPDEYFGRVASLDFDRDGNLHVLDPDRYRVTTWNTEGAFLRRFGSRGDGPMEFRVPRFAFTLRNGNVVVVDIGHSSLRVFGTRGEHLRNVRLPSGGDRPVPGRRSVLTAGRLVGPNDHWMSRPSPTSEEVPLFSYSFARDSLAASLYYEAWGPPINQMDWAMAPRVRIAAFVDGRVALVDSMGYRVKVLSETGELESVVERPILPFPVTDLTIEAEQERARARLTENDVARGLRDMAAVVDIPIPNVDVARVVGEYRENLDDKQFNDEIPVIREIGVDWDDRMWITRSDATGGDGPIDLMRADGTYVGTLLNSRMPDAFGPDGHLAYIENHEIGTQGVVVVRITSIVDSDGG